MHDERRTHIVVAQLDARVVLEQELSGFMASPHARNMQR